MSDKISANPSLDLRLNSTEHHTSIEEFTRYCNEEKERRKNSGDKFDEQTFDKAVGLTLRKLQVLEDEGWT